MHCLHQINDRKIQAHGSLIKFFIVFKRTCKQGLGEMSTIFQVECSNLDCKVI
jgi:hypothetical protein